MLRDGWYQTIGGHLVSLHVWADPASHDQKNCGTVVNVGTFFCGDGGNILQQEGEPVPTVGLALDLTSWRSPYGLASSATPCEMHGLFGCVACDEGYVPFLADRIQTGDIIMHGESPTSPHIRVMKMSLDGMGGVFEVIKKDGTPDRRYEGWSGSFDGYRLLDKRTGRVCQSRDDQEQGTVL